MADSPPMSAAFIGHGSPMNTLDDNRYTRACQRVRQLFEVEYRRGVAFGHATARERGLLLRQ